MTDRCPAVLYVAVPHERKVAVRAGDALRIHRMRGMSRLVHPSATPPRLRLEVALLAFTERLVDLDKVLVVVLRSTQRRLTTAARLRAELTEWPRHRWRALLIAVLSDVSDGVASPLELRYARFVERAHGLPHGERNRPEGTPGQRRYYDVRYSRWGLLVKLDGRETHPPDEAFRDLRRDNAAMLAGDRVLRYGWQDVAGRACLVATQVVVALRTAGWSATPHPCGPRCEIGGSG